MNNRNIINSQFNPSKIEEYKSVSQQNILDIINYSLVFNELEIFETEEAAKNFILSIVDLTTLEGSDNSSKIEALCNKAIGISKINSKTVAAICVYPSMVEHVSKYLNGAKINIASVAGAFPSGQSPLHLRVAEVEYAIQMGANEIDMVISRGKFLEKNYNFIYDEICAIREVCGENAHLKVIFETGELQSNEQIYWASMIAMNAGADFIKTSTGKIAIGATPEAVTTMLYAIKAYYDKTGIKVGIKPAGGISNYATAIAYTKLVYLILGKEWLTPQLFRLGASRLVDELL